MGRLTLHKQLSWRTVGDSIVVLDLRTSRYLSVTGSGKLIWEMLAEGATEDEIVAGVLTEYDVEEAVGRSEVLRFLDTLRDKQLLL